MKKSVSSLLSVSALFAFGLSSEVLAQTTLLSEDFSGSSVNQSTWTLGGNWNPAATVASGAVTLTSGAGSAGYWADLATNATNFNPFEGNITVALSGISLAGSSLHDLFVVVGRNASDTGGSLGTYGARNNLAASYNSQAGSTSPGGSVSLYLRKAADGTYSMNLQDSGGGLSTVRMFNTGLSGAPSDIVWTVNGASNTFTVSLTGATFTSTGLSTYSGSFAYFTQAGLDADSVTPGIQSVSRFGVGVAGPGTATVDNILVTTTAAVPEPSTAYAIIACAGILGYRALRRRSIKA